MVVMRARSISVVVVVRARCMLVVAVVRCGRRHQKQCQQHCHWYDIFKTINKTSGQM
jgi:hypothetical protein